MRIFLTGRSGLLGRAVLAACAGDQLVAPTSTDVDITRDGDASAAIAAARPDAVIHCAAITDVDRCQREPDLTYRVNAGGCERVARAAAAVGARLVAVSTDYVFGADRGRPLTEDDRPDPINVYGASKWAGERAVLDRCPGAVVARVSWLYDRHRGFAAAMIERARSGATLEVVGSQVGVPTSARVAARALRRLAELKVRGPLHVVCSGGTTRLEWVRTLLDSAGVTAAVGDVPAARFGGAPRPVDSRLDNRRARDLGLVLPSWKQELVDVFA